MKRTFLVPNDAEVLLYSYVLYSVYILYLPKKTGFELLKLNAESTVCTIISAQYGENTKGMIPLIY